MASAPSHTARLAPSRAEILSGGLIIALCAAIGTFTLIVGEPIISTGAWAGLLGLWLLLVLTAGYEEQRTWLPRTAFALSVLASWALVLTLPTGGMVEIILVVTVAMGVHVAPLIATAAVVALNTGVIALGALRGSTGEGELQEVLFFTGFYLVIQVSAMLSTSALLREGQMRRRLEEQNVELTATSVLLEETTRTAERLRISRDLHDLIGHQLTVLSLELEAAKHRSDATAAVRPHVDRAAAVAKDLLRDVRSTVGSLRAHEAPDLHASLSRIADAVPGLSVRLSVDPRTAADEDTAAAVVRTAQEVITNALRHSDARVLSITVERAEDSLVLTAHGDDSGPARYTEGNGLRGIRERIELLGGGVTVAPAQGFRLTAHVPSHEAPLRSGRTVPS
ncbi:sensor histidine kinase [Brevibacterium album]|uniref:sensor histidine kinase n=1 Tax=Brevibacterium album TaxID=417948 RepID=UPI00041C1D01|nr:histidine kinase [Brevibacterium album]